MRVERCAGRGWRGEVEHRLFEVLVVVEAAGRVEYDLRRVCCVL